MAVNVKAKLQELLAICKDENRGIDSAEAKEILAELAKEKVNIKQQILRVDPSSYKAYAEQISSAINDLRKDNSAPESSEPQGKKEEKTADPEVKTPTVVKEDNAPETESDTQKRQLSDMQKQKLEKFASIAKKMKIDISAVTPNNFGRTLSELERRQVTIDLREYIFGRADKCSDFATDYIEAKGIKTQYQEKHWQKVLGVLENAIKPQKNGAEPNTDRLVEIATKVSEISTNKKITEQASEFLKKITSQQEKQGEEKMAEDNENTETKTGNEGASAPEEKTPAYKPRETLMKMARIANVGLNGIENDEALIAIIQSNKRYKVKGDQLLRIDGSNETEVDIDAEIKKLDDEAEKKANPVEFSAMESTPTPTPTENEDNKWIAEKIAYYNSLSEAQKINNYVHDESITDGFAASFNDAKIHYTTKTNVAVSKDALYSVYDVMLKDPHNVGRPVNFSDNMTPEMAARLYAACIVNGNEMGGAVPQLTDEMKNQLKEEMGADDYAVFEAKLAARTQNASEQNSQAQTVELDEATKKDVKQAMKDQYNMSVMENNGTIKKTADGYEKGENGTDEDLQKYNEMSERAKTGKPMLFEQFKKSPEEFRKLMNEVIEEEKLGIKLDDVKIKIQERKNTKKGSKTYAGFDDNRDKVRNVGLEIPNIGAIDLSR